jgi:hypothetical protein
MVESDGLRAALNGIMERLRAACSNVRHVPLRRMAGGCELEAWSFSARRDAT